MRTKNKKFNIINWWPGIFALILPVLGNYRILPLYTVFDYALTDIWVMIFASGVFLSGAFMLIKAWESYKKNRIGKAIFYGIGSLIVPTITSIILLVILALLGGFQI